MKRILPFVFFSLLSIPNVFAETAVLNQVYNARSSSDFTTRENIIGVVPEGTQLEILQRKELPSGNYGLRVRVISVGKSFPTTLRKDSPPFWIYYDMNKTLRVVDLQNKKGDVVENPDDAVRARANQNFRMKPNLAAAEKNTVDCVKCAERATAANPDPAPPTVVHAIANIQQASGEDPAVMQVEPSKSEISRYLQVIENHVSRSQIANDNRIAGDVIASCKGDTTGLLIPLVLAVMKEESHLSPGVHDSRKGAEGLMQILPETARELHCGADLHNVEINIKCGVKYIKQLLEKHPNDPKAVLEAYNAGPNAEEKIAAGEKRISKETRNYVAGAAESFHTYYDLMKTWL